MRTQEFEKTGIGVPDFQALGKGLRTLGIGVNDFEVAVSTDLMGSDKNYHYAVGVLDDEGSPLLHLVSGGYAPLCECSHCAEYGPDLLKAMAILMGTAIAIKVGSPNPCHIESPLVTVDVGTIRDEAKCPLLVSLLETVLDLNIVINGTEEAANK